MENKITETNKRSKRHPRLQEFDCYLKVLLDELHQKYLNNGKAAKMKENDNWFRVLLSQVSSSISDAPLQYQNVDKRYIKNSLCRLARHSLIKGRECVLDKAKSFWVKVA